MSHKHGLLRLRCKDRVGKGKGEALGLFPSPAAAGDAEGKPGPTPCGAHPALSQDGLEPRIRRGGTGAASTEAAPFLSARPRALLRGSGAGTGKKKNPKYIYIYIFYVGKKERKNGKRGGKKKGGKRLFPTGPGRPTPPPGGAVAPRRGRTRGGGQPGGALPTGRTGQTVSSRAALLLWVWLCPPRRGEQGTLAPRQLSVSEQPEVGLLCLLHAGFYIAWSIKG